MDPVVALERIAHRLEAAGEPTFRVKAFRGAAATLSALPPGELEKRAKAGRLRDLPGVGETTARVISEALAGAEPRYLTRLETEAAALPALDGPAAALRDRLVGDCHTHSDWSDGGSPIDVMARTAAGLGHRWMALTDHSPRLTVAKGLSPERLRRQLDVVAGLNSELAPFRILTGIEVDIAEDGRLDQDEDLLGRLDLVVASVHSKLRMERSAMTRRMVTAVANPHVDVLGHCTGRMLRARIGSREAESEQLAPAGEAGNRRPESTFDAELVFEACRQFDVAVEVNSRPERLDPPRRLLRLAAEMGCRFAVDTDAHAPGQLEWQRNGCARAAECGVGPEQVVNTWEADRLTDWTASRSAASRARRTTALGGASWG